jgi:serine/threonine-protein kinase
MLSGTTSEPVNVEATSLMNELSENARRRYELLDELGRGAMGIVYRAKDIELDEVVALKILPDNLSNNPEAVRRFKIEARSARRLAHPNIVRIHDIGEELGRKYISMEYIEGTDLKKIIRKHKKLDDSTVVKFAQQIADALGYAHSMGIVHRDIKPANIMITNDNRVKVADYGIAKMVESTDATVAGAVIGTPLYMAPEQVKGDPIDHRVDIYSFGVLMYELLNGKPPFFEGDLAYQHIHKEPAPLEGVDEELAAVVMKCLEKDCTKRYESGRDIHAALSNISRKFGSTTAT